MRITPLLLCLLVCRAALAVQPDVAISTDNVHVDYLGSSMKFRLTYPADDRTYTMEVDELQEYDIDGLMTSNKVTNLASHAVVLHPPVFVSNNVTMVMISGDLSVGATTVPMMFETFISDLSYTINGTLVPARSFKYSLRLGAWPFLSAVNTLRFSTILKTKTGDAPDVDGASKDKFKLIGTSDEYVFSPVVLLDGVSTDTLGSNMTLSGNKRTFSVDFAAYTSSLEYDPYLAFNVSTSSSLSAWVIILIVFGVLMVCTSLILAMCFTVSPMSQAYSPL